MICYGLWQKTIIYVVCVGLKLQNDNKKNKSQNSAGNIGNNDWKFYDVFIAFPNWYLFRVTRFCWFYREFKEKNVREIRKYFKKQKTLTIETIYRNRPNVLNLINMNYKKKGSFCRFCCLARFSQSFVVKWKEIYT